MKRLTALFCAAAMTLTMGVTAMALPSVSSTGAEKVTVSAEAAALIPEGKELAVKTADPKNYEVETVAKAVEALNNIKEGETVSTAAVMRVLGFTDLTKITTADNKTVDLTGFEPITKFADLMLTDGTSVEFDANGETVSIEATISAEVLKDVQDLANILLMQMDPKTGEVYFIEVTEENFNGETGELTVKFPCLGPFTILEK